jgi:hypothetical protein
VCGRCGERSAYDQFRSPCKRMSLVVSNSVGRANGSLTQLRAAPRANGDAARPLPRLTVTRQERTATDVTPSRMSQPRRFSAGPTYRRLVSCSEKLGRPLVLRL